MNAEPRISRRTILTGAACAAAVAAAPGTLAEAPRVPGERPAHRRRIRQSIAFWCWNSVGWTVEMTAQAAADLGCPSVELVDPADWSVLRRHHLSCAIAMNYMPGAPFVKGLNNVAYHDEVIGNTKRMIDACAASNGLCSQVIAFTGYKYRRAEDPASGEIPRDEGAANCVKGLTILGEYAAKSGVTVSIEQLNTRDDTHPMKGHPGYQGDDIDWVADIVKEVNLPNVKLLFDVYHVQIMNGDLIRRIREYADLIGHVHVAGNPGRGELHIDQEINYPAVLDALAEAGYEGYVGQEFIPTGDPMDGLRRAFEICDV